MPQTTNGYVWPVTVLICALILALSIILGPRHTIVVTGDGSAVRLDRWTGKAYRIRGHEEWPIRTLQYPPGTTIRVVPNP